jgi:hypothetical protein
MVVKDLIIRADSVFAQLSTEFSDCFLQSRFGGVSGSNSQCRRSVLGPEERRSIVDAIEVCQTARERGEKKYMSSLPR